MVTDCPCGSGAAYTGCCGPLHDGSAVALSAEQLMRSRYSAFAVGDAQYLLTTWHPSTRPASVDVDPAIQWRRLRIGDRSGGTGKDDTGTVGFVAHYWDAAHGEYGRLQENSRFTRTGGRWYYVGPAS